MVYKNRYDRKRLMDTFLYSFISIVVTTVFICGELRAQGPAKNIVHCNGIVLNEDGIPLVGATVEILPGSATTQTDGQGRFLFSISEDINEYTLIIRMLGYETQKLLMKGKREISVIMIRNLYELGEVPVYSTGYQQLPQERVTGSFLQVDSSILDRQVSANILERLDGQVGGILFDKRSNGIGKMANVSIRGQSTIFGNSAPLVILDNFPYDGDIDNINPNSIESVTILRDAAAASIWGTRASNGVVVITTKKGKLNQKMNVTFKTNISVGERSNLSAIPIMDAHDYINVEEMLFTEGAYKSIENSPSHPGLSPAIELMIKRRDNLIDDYDFERSMNFLRNSDVRNDLRRYVYEPSFAEQYALDIQGGTDRLAYLFSAGYDAGKSTLDARNNRLNLRSENSFSFTDRLKLNIGMLYTSNNNSVGRPHWSGISIGTLPLYPYTRLADENGLPFVVGTNYREGFMEDAESKGLLDWRYRPLQEFDLLNNRSTQQEVLINTGLTYEIIKGIDLNLKYRYRTASSETINLQSNDSYYVRDYINTFTEILGSGEIIRRVPLGDILDGSTSRSPSHSFRGMLNFNKRFSEHQISGILGTDISQISAKYRTYRTYGYNDDVLTSIPVNYTDKFPLFYFPVFTSSISDRTSYSERLDRSVSYYTNLSYTFRERYIFSASARRDGSNIFGINANQRLVPLWSTGISYVLTNEPYFNLNWLSYLKLRATYGYNGNVDNSLSAFTTMSFSPYIGTVNNLPFATILNPPNPDLRWEKTRNINLGMDFTALSGRIRGSIDFYTKNSKDLIGVAQVDPTTGVAISTAKFGYKGNVASMNGRGIDMEVHTSNLTGRLGWKTDFYYSNAQSKVTDYMVQQTTGSSIVSAGSTVSPLIGKPVYSIFSYKWAGLDPETGDPRGYIGDVISKDYSTLTARSTLQDLVYSGPALPVNYGNVRNSFTFKNIDLSFNISYRLGYYFRRASINYSSLYSSGRGHADFSKRWQSPSDELSTNVPSMVYPTTSSRDAFYGSSEATVAKGDNIRLRDVRISYGFDINKISFLRNGFVKGLQLYAYADNISFIWKAYKGDIDPDILSEIPLPRTISFGIKTNFQ